jgi:hypothetical protein
MNVCVCVCVCVRACVRHVDMCCKSLSTDGTYNHNAEVIGVATPPPDAVPCTLRRC